MYKHFGYKLTKCSGLFIRFLHQSRKHVKVNNEVNEAFNNLQPIVALESTIITHGMPYPSNYK